MLDGSGQRLHGRMLGHADLAEAQALVPGWLPLAPQLRAALPVIWARLLGHSGFNADVIEDLNRPPGQRLVGLGVAIALDDAWRRRLADAPPPFAPALIYTGLQDGSYQLPSDKELARLSGRGEVAFLVLHYAQVLEDLSNPDTLEILDVAMTLFRQAHAGYRLQCLYQEGLGNQGAYLRSMGFLPRTARGQDGVPELQHRTVLLEEAVDALLGGAGPEPAGTWVDGTFGRGGHSRLILLRLGPQGRLVAFDKDPEAIAEATRITDARFSIRHEGFRHIADLPAGSASGVLMDLGVSSPQIDSPGRGFSFRFDGPLDMRMDPTRGQSVAEWLAEAEVQQIAEVIREYAPLQRRLLLGAKNGVLLQPPQNWPISWLARSRPASRARTLQRAHFRLFGFSSTPSLKSCNRR